MKAISTLNPPKSSGEKPKVRLKQTKCSKDFRFSKERTSRWMCLISLENNVNLPDLAAREDGWEVASLILLYEVRWFGIIAQAADLDCWGCCWSPRKTCIFWSACEASGFRADERTFGAANVKGIFIPVAWQRHWQTSIWPQCYSCRPEAVIGIN